MKLIVMDMDGTLLTSDKKIDQETLTTLIDHQKRGDRLVLASGRVKARLDEFAKTLKMDEYGGYLIEANGSCIYSYQEQKREIIREMTHEEIDEILQYMKQQFPHNEVIVMADVNAYVNLVKGQKESGYFNANNMESLRNRDIIYFQDVHEIKEMFFKVCVFDTPEKIDEMALIVQRDLSHKYWSGKTMPFWLEILPKEVSKGNALLQVMKELNVKKEEVYAFGDGENDISMLQVGHGIAMENATQSVKAVCESITLSNEKAGIAAYLKKLK